MAAAVGLEALWSGKTDAQLFEALACVSDYTDEAQAVIRAECLRRGIEPPRRSETSSADVAEVTRLYDWYVRCVSMQWLAIGTAIIGPEILGARGMALVPLCVLIFLAMIVAVPVIGIRLLARLGDHGQQGSALIYVPIFGLLALFGLRGLVHRWRRLHGVDA